MVKKLEAVIFDYDGTILDSEQTYYDVMKVLIKKHTNRELDKLDYIFNVSGTSVEQCKKYIMETYSLNEEEYAVIERDIAKTMHTEIRNSKVLPYIEEVFSMLKENDIKIAVASNGTLEHIIDGLKEKNLYKYVDDIVTKYDVENGKPAPDVYLLAADRLGVEIENCIAVEDSRPGAQAAVSSGAYVIVQTNNITKHFNFDDVDYNEKDCNLCEVIKNML